MKITDYSLHLVKQKKSKPGGFRRAFLFLCLLLGTPFSYSSALPHVKDVLILGDQSDYIVRGNYLEAFEDSTGLITINDILNSSVKFYSVGKEYSATKNKKSYYWLRFKLKINYKDRQRWLLEILDSRQNVVELYEPAEGIYITKKAGFSKEFSNREYKHKNFIFEIFPDSSTNKYYYLRAQADVLTSLIFKIRSSKNLLEYSVREYYFLGLFYGLILIMALFSLFVFITIRQKIYILYFLYIASWLFSTLSSDNIGFQFFWTSFPELSRFGFYFSRFILLVSFVFYSLEYLSLKDKLNNYRKILIYCLPVFLIIFSIQFVFNTSIKATQVFFLFPFVVIFFIAIKSYLAGFKPSLYFFIGNFIVLLALIIGMLHHNGLLTWLTRNPMGMIIVTYSTNIAVVLEITLFSLGMADRLRFFKKEKDYVQNLFVEQLKENQNLSDQAKRELEEKIEEIKKQKNIIEDKSTELDLFLYKSSHNLKGPVKSIIGLSNLGSKESDAFLLKTYFRLIRESAKGLDKDLKNLKLIFEINSYTLCNSVIPLHSFFKEYIHKNTSNDTLKATPEEINFYSDRFMLDMAFRNIFYAVKSLADDSSFSILVKYLNEELCVSIVFKSDHANVRLLEKAFDAFNIDLNYLFRINFELYIAKVSINKLQGKIVILYGEENTIEFKTTIPEALK